jgi:hypothetical protein
MVEYDRKSKAHTTEATSDAPASTSRQNPSGFGYEQQARALQPGTAPGYAQQVQFNAPNKEGVVSAGDGDGSGAHGAVDPTMADYANAQVWWNVASGADAMGMTNAARHMRHYLGNTGAKLNINPELSIRDSKEGGRILHEALLQSKREAIEMLDGCDTSQAWDFDGFGGREGGYFEREDSPDWYFAVGGFTGRWKNHYHFEPDSEAPGTGHVTTDVELELFDRYNWDQGKSVTIAGVTVTDERLGQLHKAGIAQEYEVSGKISRTIDFPFRGLGKSGAYEAGDAEDTLAGDNEGGRVDPTRVLNTEHQS